VESLSYLLEEGRFIAQSAFLKGKLKEFSKRENVFDVTKIFLQRESIIEFAQDVRRLLEILNMIDKAGQIRVNFRFKHITRDTTD